MKTEIKCVYKCGSCSEVHDDEEEARECCMPEIIELYECPICKDRHHEEEDAVACCGIELDGVMCPGCMRDYGAGQIDQVAVKVAGHCRTCNPMFTVDQQLAIEDMHWQVHGKAERVFA